MKSKFFLYIATALFFSLFSCEKEIYFRGDEIKTKLVLNGFLAPDSIVKINLSESKFFLDDNWVYNYINNAKVDLWKDGNKIESLSNVEEGFYIGTYIPKIGDNIKITASCEGFEMIECSTEIVIPTPIISVDTVNYKEEKQYNGYYSEDGIFLIDSLSYYLSINTDIFIKFQDPKDIPNYYDLMIYLNINFANKEKIVYPLRFFSDDLVFQTGNDFNFLDDNNHLNSTLFSDELFDGKEYKLKIKSDYWSGIYIKENLSDPHYGAPAFTSMEISFELQSLSYSYYMYRKTLEAHYNLNDFIEFFSEPVQIYSNIKGGIGILGSYSKSVYKIRLK